MRMIKPYYKIKTRINGISILKKLEKIARICYKSENKIIDNSYEKIIKNIIKNGHESVLEHISITVLFCTDRGISHELVRHRLASFTQESTRYVKYSGDIEFIIPNWINIKPGVYNNSILLNDLNYDDYIFLKSLYDSVTNYLMLLDNGWSPQKARNVLPNALKTEICVTANLREWRHIFKLRTASGAHPQFRELTIPLLKELNNKIPIIFEDILIEKE